AHHGALARVAIAAATKHDRKPVARIGSQSLEGLRERIGLVGIIDENGCAASLAHELKPPLGALEGRERGEHRGGLASGRDRQPRCNERVLDLKIARERPPERGGIPPQREVYHQGTTLERK